MPTKREIRIYISTPITDHEIDKLMAAIEKVAHVLILPEYISVVEVQ